MRSRSPLTHLRRFGMFSWSVAQAVIIYRHICTYRRTHQNTPTVLSVICLIAIASTIIQTRAFGSSFRTTGGKASNASDVDFYTNLQISLLQLLGLCTTLLPALKLQFVRNPGWTWAFAARSFACSVSYIGIYFWFSSLAPLVIFVGCLFLQSFMVLQLVWLIDENERREKVEWVENKVV